MKETHTPKSILEAFENIVEGVEDSKLSDEFFERNGVSLRYIGSRLGFTPLEAVFMAILVDKSDERNVSLASIAKYVGCRTTRILRVEATFEALESRRYIRIINGKSGKSYRVPQEVVKALSADKPYVYERENVTDVRSFFDVFRKLVGEKDDDELTYVALSERVQEMLAEIRESSLARGIRKYKLGKDDTMLFVFMAYLYVEDDNDDIRLFELERLYENDELPTWVRRELRDRSSVLMTQGLVENTHEEGMARSDAFKLTEKAKMELLADIQGNEVGKSTKGLIQHADLVAKELYYNAVEGVQIKELTGILAQEKFGSVQERLADAGLRTGFCCLFHGAPGTGKTETVYQIARATGRDIMQVDVDKIKSCWVGESEKNIKAVFDRYRNISKSASQVPILLFNEADAILGVRMEGVARAADKMENSIQNIILQEMEKFEGIMIATTNLTTNLDKAFERRFLYKIKFERPSMEARMSIWLAMMKGLNREEAKQLATQFDLSGGEIENVVRRHTARQILHGCDKVDVSALQESCRAERLASANPRIGF